MSGAAFQPVHHGDQVGWETSFDRHAITRTRHAVAAWAASAGLLGQRLESFVLAVNEIITNAVRHGGGRGRLRLWASAGVAWCEIRDHGHAAQNLKRASGQELPPTSATGGRGLYLARQLCDTLSVHSAAEGTTVRLAMALPVPK
jgi:serine/threonine-protein kinase RsbW